MAILFVNILCLVEVFFGKTFQAELLLDKSLNLTPCIFGEFSILRRACFSKNYAILKLLHILRNFLKRMVISLRAFYIGLRSPAFPIHSLTILWYIVKNYTGFS